MRVIETIPHPSMLISIFKMNDKFIVKIEAGPMEQTFKFSEEEVNGIAHIKSIFNEDFIDKIRVRFNEMYKDRELRLRADE